jgi:TonB family protein
MRKRFRESGLLVAVAGMLAAAAPAWPASGDMASTLPPCVTLNRHEAAKLLTSQIKPEYPAVARVNYIQGRVHAQIEVSEEGKVVAVHILDGHALLAASTIAAVRKWRYQPLRTPTGIKRFTTDVEVNFSLHIRRLTDVPSKPAQDLSRQVQPPHLSAAQAPDATKPGEEMIPMRVLVDESGDVMDVYTSMPETAEVESTIQNIREKVFEPAHWGTIAVPWYLELQVPVEPPPQTRANLSPATK